MRHKSSGSITLKCHTLVFERTEAIARNADQSLWTDAVGKKQIDLMEYSFWQATKFTMDIGPRTDGMWRFGCSSQKRKVCQ